VAFVGQYPTIDKPLTSVSQKTGVGKAYVAVTFAVIPLLIVFLMGSGNFIMCVVGPWRRPAVVDEASRPPSLLTSFSRCPPCFQRLDRLHLPDVLLHQGTLVLLPCLLFT
jgi:hypothetical protein